MNEWRESGAIRIADNVVAVIASIATLDTDGVAGMSGGFAEGIAKRVSGKQAQKGVQVVIEEDEARIDLRLIVDFGEKIDQVCKNVQVHVKETVENMTGISVKEVNVRVEGVNFTGVKDTVIPSYQV